MTTKPKAKKFRIRRSTGAAAAAITPSQSAQGAASEATEARVERLVLGQNERPAQPTRRHMNPLEAAAAAGHEDGFPKEGFQTAKSGAVESAAEVSAEAEIDAIRKEALTGRQLRMARRVAQKHGIAAVSDFDAVRLLRREGIDPFKRTNMLELVSAEGDEQEADNKVQLPQTIEKAQLPSSAVMDAASRARSVQDIQIDIARRRRRKVSMLFMRLIFFVGLPTLLAGYYYYNVATPMYATKSEFVIQTAESSSGGMGSLFAGSGFATSQDSITVQSYLTSRDAMLRLDADHGYKAHFEDPEIDAVQRLDEGSTNEKAYKLYKKNVKIGFDPTEGIVKMEVVAATPEKSAEFSEALISYAEQRVDNLTQRLRGDQMQGSNESFKEAEEAMLAAQQEVLRLQEEVGVVDASSEVSALMAQIGALETRLLEKNLSLQQLLDNSRPNQARVDGTRGDIARLEASIAVERAKLTEATGGIGSLAQISGKLTIARTNLETRTMLMQQALEQRESARLEANKQTRYLELGVRPVAPDEPTYPRSFENTILAFLIFSGIYLMASLTASILREQVSS